MSTASHWQLGRNSLLKSLISAKADDSEPKRVDLNLTVLHGITEHIGHTGGPAFALHFGVCDVDDADTVCESIILECRRDTIDD